MSGRITVIYPDIQLSDSRISDAFLNKLEINCQIIVYCSTFPMTTLASGIWAASLSALSSQMGANMLENLKQHRNLKH